MKSKGIIPAGTICKFAKVCKFACKIKTTPITSPYSCAAYRAYSILDKDLKLEDS